MRPDVGTQSQFRKKKPPRTYRYDSSLAPSLEWDGQSGSRELGEWLLDAIGRASALKAPHEFATPQEFKAPDGRVVVSVRGLRDAVDHLKRLSKPFLNWTGKAERLSFDVPRTIRDSPSSPASEVELVGLDTFDPATMETDHRSGDDVPAWFVDTDYNGLCFHVSQAFFPRTGAWNDLRKALKGDYDDSVWDHLAGTTSAPFEAGEHRQVAVKVIDDRGNELLVVKPLS